MKRIKLAKPQNTETVENVDVYACEGTNIDCNYTSGCGGGTTTNVYFCGGSCGGDVNLHYCGSGCSSS